MKIRIASWKIKTLVAKKEQINPKPQYQRTSVWSIEKKRLLIDSILRGYDIPKFYLRTTPADKAFEYEVTDGQQRMRAIWEFVEGEYSLKDFRNGKNVVKNIFYSDLDSTWKGYFDSFEITIALIEEATPEEIRSLFARLQMGSSLNPVELRHATASNIGSAIISISENHNFFDERYCKIRNTRFQHQNYLDHVITLAFNNGKTDIRAIDIKKLYEQLAASDREVYAEVLKITTRTLDEMYLINKEAKGIFKNKWSFVDSFWLIYQQFALGFDGTINAKEFASQFLKLEARRKKYNSNSQRLIEVAVEYDKDLYEYIQAFKYSGNMEGNLATRNRVFSKTFYTTNIFVPSGQLV